MIRSVFYKKIPAARQGFPEHFRIHTLEIYFTIMYPNLK